ncbi:hypothetical protein IMZ48_47025 [Candidatus Bathyarchaeota archaeon]|nr:hypothetical protein [Candidatus Bathyarchaeota archaeon]
MVDFPEIQPTFYLIDIQSLGARAFNTPGPSGWTLAKILEDCDLYKLFFDIRDDAAILHDQYGIYVQNIWEVQLMEIAARLSCMPKLHLDSLSRCIERDSGLSSEGITAWKSKRPIHSVSVAALCRRPLLREVVDYAISDVEYLPLLAKTYCCHLSDFWVEKVAAETSRRLLHFHLPSYQPSGEQRETGPRQVLEQETRQDLCNENDLAGDLERLTWGDEPRVDSGMAPAVSTGESEDGPKKRREVSNGEGENCPKKMRVVCFGKDEDGPTKLCLRGRYPNRRGAVCCSDKKAS